NATVTGIIEETVEPTMLFDHAFNGRLNVRLSNHVHMDVAGAGPKLFHEPLSAVVLDVRYRDRGSLFDEQPRGRFPNTTCRSCDQPELPAKSVHVAALPSGLRIVPTPVANPLALAPLPPSPASTSCPSRGTSSSRW